MCFFCNLTGLLFTGLGRQFAALTDIHFDSVKARPPSRLKAPCEAPPSRHGPSIDPNLHGCTLLDGPKVLALIRYQLVESLRPLHPPKQRRRTEARLPGSLLNAKRYFR